MFLAMVKKFAQEELSSRGMEDVYEKLKFTVIEDAGTLDGANIMETSKLFRKWVSPGGEGRQELRGSVFEEVNGDDPWEACPRYMFFAHVDEESLESVVTNTGTSVGCYCKIVRPDAVFSREEERQLEEEEGEDEADDEDYKHDLEKRVRIDDLVGLYELLVQNVDSWYNIGVHGQDGKEIAAI